MSTTSNNLTQFKAESPEAIMNSFDTKGSQKRSKRSKKIACTECRQQKAKCDASERQPHPCSRCEKRKIPCKLDSEFKRTFKRAKIDELVKEYEIIKSKLNSNMLNDTKQIPVQIQQQPPPLQQQQQPQPQPQAQTQQSFLPPIQYVSNSRANISGGNSYPIQASSSNGSPLNDTAGYGSAVPSNSYNNHATHVSSSGIPGSINRQMGPNISGSGNVKPATPLSTLNRQFSPFSMRPISPLGQDMSLISGMQLSSSYNQPIKSPVIVPTPGIQYSTNISSPNITNKINSSLNLSTLISAANASDNLSKGFTNGSAITASNNVNKQAATVSQLEPGKLSNLRVCRPVRKPKIDQSLLSCTPKSLGEVTLNEDQIVVLYSTFLTHYHPLLPVIDMEKSIEKIYKLCPILFWTMMFTALRGHHSLEPAISPEECKELYFTLSPVIKSVLAEITISPITRYAPSEADESILNASSVYSVQAFLIYTFWPPLTSSLSADSSWNSIGIAFYQAIRLGLHTPGLTSDRSKSSDLLNENIRTWIACNVVSQTIASVFGYPSFFQPYGSLTLALSKEGNDVPHCLRQMLEIQTFEEQIEKTLNKDDQKVSDDHQNVVTNTLSGSVGSETRSSSKRKTNYSAENAARKIISTIPLDPQPISIAETPNDSTSNSKGGSPFASYKSPNTYSDASKKIITPQSLALNSASNYHSSPDHRSNQNSKRTPNDTKSVSSTPLETGAAAVLARPAESQNANTEPVKSDSTVGLTNSNVDALGPTPTTNTGFFIDNWDLNADFDSDMLFKDIASVMDEFGFHAG
ncbi:Regulatory protein LEU3 [Pichia kudriavzevii]|uniref:Regulatory protein LEU3 n=1 Tax=Pichia kudriavzevii TaxID=4909 RepID=A0A1V2LNH3_PICKU|nr:Regulatory protein LEU3 [Pichia kudriavzevii]